MNNLERNEMKNSIKTIKQAVLGIIFTALTISVYAQPPHCDTCVYDYDHTRKGHMIDSVLPYTPPQILTEYLGCPQGINGERNISFIHGLGGSIASWSKQSKFTRDNYETSSFGVDYTSSTYEVNFDEVTLKINTDLYARLSSGVDQSFPNRCNQADFAIAHSQGGLAGRHLDRYWDLQNSTYGTRKIFGLVTFATPHSGANISLTKESHKEFVQQAVSTVILAPINEAAYDLTEKFGFLFGKSASDILDNLDTLIKNQLAPLMLSSVHRPTLDEMIPDGPQMNAINNHQSRLRKVAFYGTEDAPECWKVMTNITDTAAENYPLWGAQADHYFQDKMELVRDEHIAKISTNKGKLKSLEMQANAPVWGFIRSIFGISKQIDVLQKNTNHREKAVTYLNNANTEWRYLIGSYHIDSFDVVTETKHKVTWREKYGHLSKWYNQERGDFNNWWEAQAHYNNVKVFEKDNMQLSTYTVTHKTLKFFPSDGVVLVKSQKAFPGVGDRTDHLPGDNHFQIRNSEETERVLEKLYLGGNQGYDDFFTTPER